MFGTRSQSAPKLTIDFFLLLIGAAFALSPACGGCGDEPPGETEVEISIANLDAETHVPFFALGHRSNFLPYGGKGLITPPDAGVLRSASIAFQGVPEGESYRVDYVGYHQLPTFPARPPAHSPWLCYYERATKIFQVVSGITNSVLLEPDVVTNRCTYLAGDAYVVNPNYTADAYHPKYGAIDGENIMALFVHGLTASADITFRGCDTIDPSCESPFGLFAALPDGVFSPWPAHTGSGWARELSATTDAAGDAMVWAVVKPGTSPQLWELEARYPAGTTPASELFRVRISNGNTVEVRAQ